MVIPHSTYYPPFRSLLLQISFRKLLSAFRISANYQLRTFNTQKSIILTNFCNPEIPVLGRRQSLDSGLAKTAGIWDPGTTIAKTTQIRVTWMAARAGKVTGVIRPAQAVYIEKRQRCAWPAVNEFINFYTHSWARLQYTARHCGKDHKIH